MKYKVKNRHISPEILKNVEQALKGLTLAQGVKILQGLQLSAFRVHCESYGLMTIDDLICQFGPDMKCEDIYPVAFLGGPRLDDPYKRYSSMRGSVLTWIMDHVLHEISNEGLTNTFNKIGVRQDDKGTAKVGQRNPIATQNHDTRKVGYLSVLP